MPEPKRIVLANGKVRYRVVVDAGRDETGKRIQVTITEDRKKDVERERDRILAQRATGSLVPPNKITVGEWLEQWLEYKRRDVEETSIRSYRLALVHAIERLGHLRLQEVTEDHLQDFVDEVITRGRRKGGEPGTRLAASTVDGILIRLKEAFGRAVVRKLIAVNPAQYVRISLADKKTDKRERTLATPWTVPEVQRFLAGIEHDRLHAPLLLALMGLRPAEVCGLSWDDVDMKKLTLTLTNTRTMIGNSKVLEKDTKTEAGTRVLPLPAGVADALKKFKARQSRERLAAGEGYTESRYLFVDALGQPRNTRHLREHTYRLMRELEMRRVRLYDARHSALTYLAVSGVPDVVLAAWAGHTNASFTKRRYVHLSVEDMRSAASAMDAFHKGSS